jgi:methylenetetrahydrofolate reductase (NADPH)
VSLSVEDARPTALGSLLRVYSVEVTAHDDRSIDAVIKHARPGTEVFIANLPNEKPRVVIEAARKLRGGGLEPVPHIVARNTASAKGLEDLLQGLHAEARVTKALILGGDREDAAGTYSSALEIIETGLLQKNGIRSICLACYAEQHPRIPEDVLQQALADKLRAAEAAGLATLLVSQFLFDPEPLVRFTRSLRERGIEAPLRVGIAGPAERTKLIRYALRCGVGASLRVLRSRGDLARNVLSGETPDDLLAAIASANADDPTLGITGAHFFTFGDPASSIRWAEKNRADKPGSPSP